jgi:pyruvate/2-oxoacid:ferredoxin oxidoreductase beta subunit
MVLVVHFKWERNHDFAVIIMQHRIYSATTQQVCPDLLTQLLNFSGVFLI